MGNDRNVRRISDCLIARETLGLDEMDGSILQERFLASCVPRNDQWTTLDLNELHELFPFFPSRLTKALVTNSTVGSYMTCFRRLYKR